MRFGSSLALKAVESGIVYTKYCCISYINSVFNVLIALCPPQDSTILALALPRTIRQKYQNMYSSKLGLFPCFYGISNVMLDTNVSHPPATTV